MKKFKIIFLLLLIFIPISIVGCKNQNKNTINAPSYLYVENGVVVFNSVENAENYILCIDDLEIFLDPNYNSNIELVDSKIYYNANKIFSVGESYIIKVKAIAEGKKDSAYSSTISYRHNAVIAIPEPTISGTTLTWNLVKNANFYIVKVLSPQVHVNSDDSAHISSLDLPEYSFHNNSFDFSSLLSTAGDYKFYVRAVLAEDNNYTSSNYSAKCTYSHTNRLATPKTGTISIVDNELMLNTIVDTKTEVIIVYCNGVAKEISIDQSNSHILNQNETDSNNLNINLSKAFSSIDFSAIKQYEFKIKAVNKTNANYYLESSLCDAIYYESMLKIATPELELTEDASNNAYLASWTCSNTTNVSAYLVYTIDSTGIKTYQVDKNSTKLILSNTIYAVYVQAIGSGNHLNSNYSNVKTINETSISDFEITYGTITNNKLPISYTAYPNATYLIEYNNNHITTSNSSYEIDVSEIISSEFEISITVITPENGTLTTSLNLNCNKQLSAPTFSANQGFKSKNPYLLTFTPVPNAIGYYIFSKSNEDGAEYQKLDNVYTTTSIDLTHLITENSDLKYFIKIQAIADLNSNYENSEYSVELEVTQKITLQAPTITPESITKSVIGNTTNYYLNFNAIPDAHSYEILINYNKITVLDEERASYTVDITKYVSAANYYEIKIRAISNSAYIFSSDYCVTNYTVYKQLPQVEDIEITQINQVYTLSFTPVSNAQSYDVRIVKIGDSNYNQYLLDNNLNYQFNISGATDVTAYIQEAGEYHFYITAKAIANGYYADADESSTYGVLKKLTNLSSPKDIVLDNDSASSYYLEWTGDVHADYYDIQITDPNQFNYIFRVYGNQTKTNIKNYFTIEGKYSIEICSIIEAGSENSKNYISSYPTIHVENYIYEKPQDFNRYSVEFYGTQANFEISDATELKNLLWYNYLYQIDSNKKLPIILHKTETESLRDAIIKLSEDAETKGLYIFSEDTDWATKYINENSSKTENDLLKYVCEKLINLYPSLHKLESLSVSRDNESEIFRIYYENALNTTKISNNSIETVATDYYDYFDYLALSERRSAGSRLAIDSKTSTMLVETTEQLLHAVESGKKPEFYGNSEIAETVYNNAKSVLKAINTNSMSDLEKTTRIYEWLNYAFNINQYANKQYKYPDGIVEANISTYGIRAEYYLEGIFLNLTNENNGGYDNEFYLGNRIATSNSFAKAFTLLCRIEGIEVVTVYGTSNDVSHTWNKINIKLEKSKKWYVVDIAKSSEPTTSISISSYKYFLITDNDHAILAKSAENTNTFIKKTASTSYNYYANSNFSFTYADLTKVGMTNIPADIGQISNEKMFVFDGDDTVNSYHDFGTELNDKKSYLLSILIYANYMMKSKDLDKFNFEFCFSIPDNNNSEQFISNKGITKDSEELFKAYTTTFTINGFSSIQATNYYSSNDEYKYVSLQFSK